MLGGYGGDANVDMEDFRWQRLKVQFKVAMDEGVRKEMKMAGGDDMCRRREKAGMHGEDAQ